MDFRRSMPAIAMAVAGGKIRHGMFYDGGVYRAPEPLSFIYYNMVIA